jgi:diguanylate cyclase (GGDEF)-like protein
MASELMASLHRVDDCSDVERKDDSASAVLTRAELKGLQALENVAVEVLDALLGRTSIVQLEPGERLLTQGEANRRMFVVIAGMLRVELDKIEGGLIARLGRGETVGEMSLLAGAPASANVTAEQPTCLLLIDEANFFWLVATSHEFATGLLIRMANRLRSNNDAVQANVALRVQFERAALHDALTGLHNRRWLDQTLPRIVQRHRFSGDPLCIALMDVDHFKRVNDRFGHPAGDTVLAAISRVIRRCLRPTDLVARMGGEEFALIFPHTPLAGGVRAVERLREAIAAEPIAHDGAHLPAVTVSIGLVGDHVDADCAELLGGADRALYRAKHSGRDRVMIAERGE